MQALLKLPSPISLTLVDRFQEFLDMARDLAAESEGVDTHSIDYALNIDQIRAPLDLAIIATTSGPRFEILSNLLSTSTVRNVVLEKFLFQDIAHYQAADDLLKKHDVACWVSCPRPVWPGYEDLKKHVGGKTGNICTVSGSKWNMASNVVHFIDCFARVSDETIVDIDGSGLDPEPFYNRREGYREVSGTIVVRGSNGGVLCMSCDKDGSLPISVNWVSGDNRFHIQEADQIIHHQFGDDVSQTSFPMLMASGMTQVYHDILTKDECGLTQYAVSADHHLKVIETLNPLFFDAEERSNPCPIT